MQKQEDQETKHQNSLDLGLIGNGTIAALVDPVGEITWMCVPRLDGDPAFCTLLRARRGDDDFGFFAVEIVDFARSEQEYRPNSPVLLTRLYDTEGGCVEITDFAPRFRRFERIFCPMMIVRRVRRLGGAPRIRVRVRPAADAGRVRRGVTSGSHHVRYVDGQTVLRLTTDASINTVMEERAFVLEDRITLVLGPDESVLDAVDHIGEEFTENTINYWHDWVRALAIPFEWQEDVIRAAITLQLNAVEDTGAIVAAVTTSIPESANSGRNWDYRFCWLRDGFMVVNALNRLGATRTMERYLHYVVNIAANSTDARLQPVYGVSGNALLHEREIDSLPGYRDMGPVRFGNEAYEQVQHDVYGSAILSAAQLFFDKRLVRGDDQALFKRLEVLGERAAEVYNQPDAGIWEFRGHLDCHTFSGAMCWAACDRLARIGLHLGLRDRAAYWRTHADKIHREISERAWNEKLSSFTSTLDGDTLDASLLLLNEMGFVGADDPRFAGTVRAVGNELRQGDYVFRYIHKDDFGAPKNAFIVCSFWYVNALAVLGQHDEARELFGKLLACRNRHGLLAEHVDPSTRELWGNFVQTYSMVGLITCAVKLSASWEQAF